MLEHTELYVDSCITIQSLASSFMLNSGCYEHVFQISGVLQQLISRCVVGGRVMGEKQPFETRSGSGRTKSSQPYHMNWVFHDSDVFWSRMLLVVT